MFRKTKEEYLEDSRKILEDPPRKECLFQIGSIVKEKKTNRTYVITNNINGEPVATRTVTILNPENWELLSEPTDD